MDVAGRRREREGIGGWLLEDHELLNENSVVVDGGKDLLPWLNRGLTHFSNRTLPTY